MAETAEMTGVKGFYRVQLTEDGEVVGDTGWRENVITNLGFNLYLVSALAAIAGSQFVGYFAIGSGTAPAAGSTTLDGEVVKRQAVTAATSSTSKTLHLTGVFNSTASFVTGAGVTIDNIGLFSSSASTGANTMFAGSTYTGSACATNQNVNVTYDIVFS